MNGSTFTEHVITVRMGLLNAYEKIRKSCVIVTKVEYLSSSTIIKRDDDHIMASAVSREQTIKRAFKTSEADLNSRSDASGHTN